MGMAGEDCPHAVFFHQFGVLRTERFVEGRLVLDLAVGTDGERMVREDKDVVAFTESLQLLLEPCQLGAGIGAGTP